MKKIFFLTVALLIFFASCKKATEASNTPPVQTVQPIFMKYAMTQCADVWGYPQTASTTPQVFFNTYFTNNNIGATYKSIFHDPNLAAVCAACTCASGDVLYVEATPAAVAQLTQMGFVQCASAPHSNVLWGDWLYVQQIGGFSPPLLDMRSLNHHLLFAGNQVTLTKGSNPPTTRTYSIVPPKPNIQYGNGIAYDNNTTAQENFMVRNDSLFIDSNVAADGFHSILIRQ
jgi:hypothetical protein